MNDTADRRRRLPSVDGVLHTEAFQDLLSTYNREVIVDLVREYMGMLRQHVWTQQGDVPPQEELFASMLEHVQRALCPSLRNVINATGVIIHTNLGRALLSADTLSAMERAGREYSNLEYDLDEGKRGSRYVHATTLLRRLTNAEDALVVNNNAAALVLILQALAKGRDVLISRGHLVEIGGGFRIPDIMAQSGARLVEVGTTNRTYIRDYRAALGEETALIMRVHASNFLITGFTHQPSLREMVALGRERGVPVVHDLGSGALLDTAEYALAQEPLVQESVSAGVDLTCFSGDKLLGGPQAGIIVGRADLVSRLKRHPLARALRVDKTTLAGLQATLMHYLRGEAVEKIPVWRMISMQKELIGDRVAHLVRNLKDSGLDVSPREGVSAIGGGALPGQTLPTVLLALRVLRPAEFAACLRSSSPPVVARIEDDQILFDLRTVTPEQDEALLEAIVSCAASRQPVE